MGPRRYPVSVLQWICAYLGVLLGSQGMHRRVSRSARVLQPNDLKGLGTVPLHLPRREGVCYYHTIHVHSTLDIYITGFVRFFCTVLTITFYSVCARTSESLQR